MSDTPQMTPKDIADVIGAIEGVGGKVVRVEVPEADEPEPTED